MNVNVDRTLCRRGIPNWREIHDSDVVPLVHFIKALEAGAEATGDEKFSMRVAERHNLLEFRDFGASKRSEF